MVLAALPGLIVAAALAIAKAAALEAVGNAPAMALKKAIDGNISQ